MTIRQAAHTLRNRAFEAGVTFGVYPEAAPERRTAHDRMEDALRDLLDLLPLD